MDLGGASVQITDNSEQVLEAFQAAISCALERCGMQAEGYAKDLCPVDSGNLRKSIAHKVRPDEKAVYIGTNCEYAVYVECGTGKFYPGGRQTPWRYQDMNGNWHRTSGQPAQPYLKPAVTDHAQTYRNIIEDEMKS